MGATGHFKSLSPWALDFLIANPRLVEWFIIMEPKYAELMGGIERVLKQCGQICPDQMQVRRLVGEWHEPALDLDKKWRRLQPLVSAEPGNAPLAAAVDGGTMFGPDLGYGPARYLTALEVRSTAAALVAASPTVLFRAVQPSAASLTEEDLPYLVTDYRELADYYELSSVRECAMLQYLM